MERMNLGIIGGIVLALLASAYLFLQGGEFFKDLKGVGYGLLALAIVIVIIVVVVVLIIEWRKSQ